MSIGERLSPRTRRIESRHATIARLERDRMHVPFLPFLRADTFDDLLRAVINALREYGADANARRGDFRELTGVLLELSNPRARISRTETRGRPFGALGEFCWYVSGRNDHAFIGYYLPHAYRPVDVSPDGTLPGAYGPRLAGEGEGAQLERVVKLLTDHPTSRRAVLQLFDARDLATGQSDVPCTCVIQFLRRDGRLHAVTYMRSNDIFRGLPHDVFCFTLLQEWVARRVGDELGTYRHAVGSLHLYTNPDDEDEATLEEFLAEGFQSRLTAMPPMPSADPEGALASLLAAECALRASPPRFDEAAEIEARLDPYWADLVRMLTALRHSKDRQVERILDLKNRMSSPTYHMFLNRLASAPV